MNDGGNASPAIRTFARRSETPLPLPRLAQAIVTARPPARRIAGRERSAADATLGMLQTFEAIMHCSIPLTLDSAQD